MHSWELFPPFTRSQARVGKCLVARPKIARFAFPRGAEHHSFATKSQVYCTDCKAKCPEDAVGQGAPASLASSSLGMPVSRVTRPVLAFNVRWPGHLRPYRHVDLARALSFLPRSTLDLAMAAMRMRSTTPQLATSLDRGEQKAPRDATRKTPARAPLAKRATRLREKLLGELAARPELGLLGGQGFLAFWRTRQASCL